jgi:hypothetical protein
VTGPQNKVFMKNQLTLIYIYWKTIGTSDTKISSLLYNLWRWYRGKVPHALDSAVVYPFSIY